MKLKEIEFIKPILIFILVAYHSFLPFAVGYGIDGLVIEKTAINGGGYSIDNQLLILYHIIDKGLYSFMLETFAFVSGYLFCYQLSKGKYAEKKGLLELIKKKTVHLMLPCFIFSSLTIFAIENYNNIANLVYKVMLGWNHLWFLPSLFVCFICAFLANKTHCKKIILYMLICVLTIVFTLAIYAPRLSFTLYLLSYFLLAFVVFEYRPRLFKLFQQFKFTIVAIWVLWFVLFAVQSSLYLDYLDGFAEKYSLPYLLLKYATSTAGVLALYFTACYYTNKYLLPEFISKAGRYCFGVYISHQYLIYILYGFTLYNSTVGCVLLPWVTTFLTLFLSLFISILFSKLPVLKDII